jgi:hypothetical protein
MLRSIANHPHIHGTITKTRRYRFGAAQDL